MRNVLFADITPKPCSTFDETEYLSVAEFHCKRMLNCLDTGDCMEHEGWTGGSLDVLSCSERQSPRSCNARSELGCF